MIQPMTRRLPWVRQAISTTVVFLARTARTSTVATAAEESGHQLPSRFRIVHASVVHRHGDRSPITPLKDSDFWRGQLPTQDVLQGVSRGTRVLRDSVEGQRVHHAQGSGPFGQLTTLGLLQMVGLGERLREELGSALFTSSRPLEPSRVRVMSTNFPRTIQSVQALLTGMFPECDAQIDIDVRGTNDFFIPDPQPRQSKNQLVLESHLGRQQHLLEKEAEMEDLARRLTRSLDGYLGDGANAVSFGIGEEKGDDDRLQAPLSWAQLSEILVCLNSRNLLPKTVTREDVEIVSKHVAWKWMESLKHPVLSKAAMWKFATQLVDDAKRCRECNEGPYLCIYSAHDSTLIGLISILQLEQPARWPEYASYLKMELIQEEKETEEVLWVRFSLNGELLRSKWLTGSEGQPLRMVPLGSLVEMIEEDHQLIDEHEKMLFCWKEGVLSSRSLECAD
mmetsp:Transcript_28044/g.66839  ORF Transcript_28044/g.66839 Transcript_28044/m.66839 type:complete len:451 (+) Transcript_28044:163-1515(+)